MCFNAVSGSGHAYLSELLHVHAPSRTPRSSFDTRMLKIQQTKARLMAFSLSLALDRTFWNTMETTLAQVILITIFEAALARQREKMALKQCLKTKSKQTTTKQYDDKTVRWI